MKNKIIEDIHKNIEKIKIKHPELDFNERYFSLYYPKHINNLDEYLTKYDYENELLKVEFNNIKEQSNRLSESIIKIGADFLISKMRDKTETETGKYLHNAIASTYINNIPGIIKKVNNTKKADPNSKEVEIYNDICQTLLPLSELVSEAKNKIVKKKTQDLEKEKEKKEIFTKTLNHKDVKQTLKILDGLTETMKEEIYKKNQTSLTFIAKKVKQFIEEETSYRDIKNNLSLAGESAIILFQKITTPNTFNTTPKIKSEEEIKNKIDDLAEQRTNMIVDEYKFRVTNKIAPIVASKDCLKDINILSYKTLHGKVESTLSLSFKDNSSFILESSAEFSYSKHGTPFIRFPSRFTAVFLPNGEKMKNPSEENMHEVFLEYDKKKKKNKNKP